jgi:hypothetical protein
MRRRIAPLFLVVPAVAVVLIALPIRGSRGRAARARATPVSAAPVARAASCAQPAAADGASDPNLVPDIVAYRLWLATVALPPGPTAAQQRRQHAQLVTAGLEGEDIGRASSALATFRTSYDYLIQSYNDSVAQANQTGGTADLQGFLSQRDALVQSTEDALAGALTADGMAKLRTYVQGQKVNMKVAPGDR